MKNAFTRNLSTPTPQTEQANERQVKNNAGGYVYQVSDQTRLERFLILGTDGGTYYQTEQDLTKQNVDWLVTLMKNKSNYWWIHNTIAEISESGRAYKNSPAIFATALLLRHSAGASYQREGDEKWVQDKKATRELVLKVCRTATHIFELAQYFELLGGWSRARRSAIADWYTQKTPEGLAYQVVKYRQRNGWTHKDLFYLVHPWVDKNVSNFILGKGIMEKPDLNPVIINGFSALSVAKDAKTAKSILKAYTMLPWEAIPTQFLKDPEVWKILFYNGQLKGQALVRNITRLSRIGAFNDMVFARDYADRLTDENMIQQSRLHPVNFLNAIVVHNEGQIDRQGYGARKKDWDAVPVIADALNDAFYKSFKYVEPAGKRTFIAIDVSPSMSSNAMGLDLSCSQVAGAMAMSVARTEPYYMIRGFASGGGGGYRMGGYSRNTGLSDLGISPSMRLDSVMGKMQNSNWGGTDCALPMKYALDNKIEIDTFLILTDNDTWAGDVHADEMLRRYRKQTGIQARMIVAGMTATDFTIADPQDAGMMDVCGADSNLPRLVSDFSAGRL